MEVIVSNCPRLDSCCASGGGNWAQPVVLGMLRAHVVLGSRFQQVAAGHCADAVFLFFRLKDLEILKPKLMALRVSYFPTI